MRLGNDVLEADLYGELGLLPDATESEIRVAYRRQARASHPDLNQHNPEAVPRMKRLNVAARVLLDSRLRSAYDQQRARSRSVRGSSAPKPSNRAWFERSELSFDNDWVPPPPPGRPFPATGFAEFFRELRGREGLFSLRLQATIDSLSTRQQLGFAAALCCLALLLILWAHPQSLMGDSAQPTSIDPRAVYP